MQDDISALLQKKKNKTLTKKHFNIAKNNCLISVFLKGSFVPSLSREQILWILTEVMVFNDLAIIKLF